jgi:hypothetical protein
MLLVLVGGCAGHWVGPPSYQYFATPDRDDPWSRKIGAWQERELSQRGEDSLKAPAAVAEPGEESAAGPPVAGELEAKWKAFQKAKKRTLAREIAAWIQAQAPEHYVPDGPIDRWATLAETLESNGDDCDGLELLTLNLLRELGFEDDEVYRAIVYRRKDGQHHMVTLWFEDRGDPWVIDPTGAMTTGMPRMSEVPGWVPLKVFSEDENFSVRRGRATLTAQHTPQK